MVGGVLVERPFEWRLQEATEAYDEFILNKVTVENLLQAEFEIDLMNFLLEPFHHLF